MGVSVSILVDMSTEKWTVKKNLLCGQCRTARIPCARMGLDTEKIRSLREKRGLTQEAAAELAGLKNRQYWNNIETGQRVNVTIDTLEKVAKALGCKAKDLLK